MIKGGREMEAKLTNTRSHLRELKNGEDTLTKSLTSKIVQF